MLGRARRDVRLYGISKAMRSHLLEAHERTLQAWGLELQGGDLVLTLHFEPLQVPVHKLDSRPSLSDTIASGLPANAKKVMDDTVQRVHRLRSAARVRELVAYEQEDLELWPWRAGPGGAASTAPTCPDATLLEFLRARGGRVHGDLAERDRRRHAMMNSGRTQMPCSVFRGLFGTNGPLQADGSFWRHTVQVRWMSAPPATEHLVLCLA
jgi:hypothetical protein